MLQRGFTIISIGGSSRTAKSIRGMISSMPLEGARRHRSLRFVKSCGGGPWIAGAGGSRSCPSAIGFRGKFSISGNVRLEDRNPYGLECSRIRQLPDIVHDGSWSTEILSIGIRLAGSLSEKFLALQQVIGHHLGFVKGRRRACQVTEG